MKDSNYYEEKRDKILDKIIDLREEYENCFPKRPFRVMTANEVLKYARTQDPQPTIPKRYLVDLAENLPIHMKINSLIGLIEKTYDVTKQEREFLYSIEKDYAI
jgi:hypothetical protein